MNKLCLRFTSLFARPKICCIVFCISLSCSKSLIPVCLPKIYEKHKQSLPIYKACLHTLQVMILHWHDYQSKASKKTSKKVYLHYFHCFDRSLNTVEVTPSICADCMIFNHLSP